MERYLHSYLDILEKDSTRLKISDVHFLLKTITFDVFSV